MNKKEMSADNSVIHVGIAFATEKNKLSGPFSDVHEGQSCRNGGRDISMEELEKAREADGENVEGSVSG